jgi:hypothetical protein
MPSLLALSRAELDVAKRYLNRRRWYAHCATLVVALGALFAPPPWAYPLALAALVSEASAWWCRYQGAETQMRGQIGLRRALILGSLGAPAAGVSDAEVATRFSRAARALAPSKEAPHYYASSRPAGIERLRDNIQESVFWSADLYRTASNWGLLFFGTASLLVVGAFAIIAAVGSSNVTIALARALVVFLTFLVATDGLSEALGWRTASNDCSRLIHQIDSADLTDQPTLLALFGDYAAATATVPPIPNWVYRTRHDDLNEAWRSVADARPA